MAPPTARADQGLLQWDLASRFVSPANAVFRLQPNGVADAGPTGLRTWIALPEGYTPDHCWPVLYLLHGSGAPREWLASLDLIRQLPAIVVMPGGGDGQFTNWWNGGHRTPAWERWFTEELMTTVQQRLPICDGRQAHAIAGTSMGGFAALMIAAQRPDYFGSAASFSGMVDIARPEVQLAYNDYNLIWGPPNGFYAAGHNPTQLASNLRSTRVLVDVGDGQPFGPDDKDYGQAALVELTARAQAHDFVAAARKAHVPVRFQIHTGIHTTLNFRQSFANMVQWGPFAAPPDQPTRWTYQTVAQAGQAWGYQFRFAAPPTRVETLTGSPTGLDVVGSGSVALRTPGGTRISAKLPFAVRGGKAVPLRNSGSSTTTAAPKYSVDVEMKPARPALSQSVLVRFRTVRKLRPDQTYQVLARQQAADCGLAEAKRVYAPVKGTLVKIRMTAGSGAGHPKGRWCLGYGKIHLLVIPRRSTGIQLGDLVGQVAFKTVSKAPGR